MDQAKEMAKIAFEALEDKKGEDVCAIDISAVSVLADYFVIANGNSDSQVRALVENVEEKMHKAGYAAKETEGHRSGAWVLIDFGDVIVHIFDRENRQFYNLERIWNDGKKIDDGYRAIHLYYQRDSYSYPIEVQLWCGNDCKFNLWSHQYVYKYLAPEIGKRLYDEFHYGIITCEEDFLKRLKLLNGGV